MEVLMVWLQFAVLTLIIMIAGYKLSLYADQIAEATGLGRNLIGLIMLSTVTSLPELMTGMSSVILTNNPNLAIGDMLGSCVFNLATVFLLDLIYRGPKSVFSRSTKGHIMMASFGIIMISFLGFSLLIGPIKGSSIGHMGVYSLLIPIFYFLAIQTSYNFEKSLQTQNTHKNETIYLKKVVLYFSLTALVIIMAGGALPFIGEKIIHLMGWNAAFVGTVFIALATSLPEIAVTISAVRLNAVELAFSNLLGSNVFNIIILTIDDAVYRKGPILAEVSKTHAVTAFSALMMTGLILIALIRPGEKKLLNTVTVISLLLLLIYLLNLYVSYQGNQVF